MSETKVISKETVQRLLRDVRYIIKNPLTDNGIYYSHDESDMMKGYAMIIGPSDTPYFGGYYFFKFSFPSDYPFSPPLVTYMTNDGRTRYNPNLYKCGKVCVSILNTWSGDKWTSCQTINSVLLTLCTLLNDEPFLNEPGESKSSKNFKPYQKSIEFCNIDFAICDMLEKKLFASQFSIFYVYMKEHFLKNYDKLLLFVESKKNIKEIESVSLYSMMTVIDYDLLKNKLLMLKDKVDNNLV